MSQSFLYSKIDTPELFEKLKNGEFPVSESDTFTITTGGHAAVLTQPKYFATSKYHTLVFKADDGSYISIKPMAKTVNSFFFDGYQFTLGMPADYKEYYLGFIKDVEFGKDDVQYIFQWTNAQKLWIFGENVIAFTLQQQLNKLKEFKSLDDIFFDVSYGTYMKLRVKPFMDTLPMLNKANFRAQAITEGQFGMFVKSQTVPTGWKCVHDKVYYQCVKK